jgi:hypothetical protein
MQTFRRLNDPERYYGLSWRGWLGAACAGGLLYLAITVSPLAFRPTVTITVLLLALGGVVLYGLSGQAIGPGRYLAALIGYRLCARRLVPPERPDRHGLVLDVPPEFELVGAPNEPVETPR